jgi:class 3 adenylate cyclase/tetratricopeptide (TPR) repeat protein
MASCPACGASVADDARFCPECGSSLGMTCPRCNAPVAAGARFCAGCGAALIASAQVVEERKVATILFADITGSTALGEQLDPERMRRLLTTYFGAMSAVIESWGGRLEKFIGDAIMATFGVPAAREDDPERAMRAALEMLERLESLNAGFSQRHGVTMQIRIGINTGDVIAPVDPGEQLMVGGDAVNVAARLEQSAEPGTIVVGERSYLATRSAFEFEPPVQLALKGKDARVAARRLVGLAPEPMPRGVPGLRGRLVGRDRELRSLLDMLDEVIENGRPHLVVLNGPAGIGKSRLVREFSTTAGEVGERLSILRGRCLPVGHGITYWALGEILRQFAAISLDEPADVAAEKLRSAVERLVDFGHLPGDDGPRVVHALAMTAGLPMPDNPLEQLAPDGVAAELARAWPAFLSAITRTGPTVVVLEDVHWAGDQLMSMVDRLVSRSTGPLLLVATARPEFTEAAHGLALNREEVSTIALRPLSDEQSAALIASLLDAAELPEGLRAEILGKAEGNPFFMEEMLRRLIDEGVLVHDDLGWQVTAHAGSVALPDSIHAVLAARIDALPMAEKRVLQEASVIGRVFWEAPVERAAGNGAAAPVLMALEQKGLILARPTTTIAGQVEYIFKHALVRDVAYASLPKSRRARAHAGAAAWIEDLAGERVDEFAELVAHHYQMAVAGEESDLAWEQDSAEYERLRRRAYESLVAAGASARRRFAIAKAVELHEAAVALAVTDAERVTAFEELGDDELARYHCDEALAGYEQALALAAGDRQRRVTLAEKIGRTCGRWGAFREKPDPERIERIVMDGLAEADTGEARARMLVARGWSFVYWVSQDRKDPVSPDRRLEWGKEALAAAEALKDPFLEMRAINALATLYTDRGLFREALEVGQRLLDLVDRQASRDLQASTFSAVADDLLASSTETARALELAERGFRLARGTSDHELMHSSAPYLRALFAVGRWSEIPAIVEEHLAAYANESTMSCPEVQFGPPFAARFCVLTGDTAGERAAATLLGDLSGHVSRGVAPPWGPWVESQIAEYLVAVGRPDDALVLMRPVVEGIAPAKLRHLAAPYAEILAALGRWDELTTFLTHIEPIIDVTPFLRPYVDRSQGRAELAKGDSARATAGLEAAKREFELLDYRFEAARTAELLAEVPGVTNRGALLQQAGETYEALGAAPSLARVQQRRQSTARVEPEGTP